MKTIMKTAKILSEHQEIVFVIIGERIQHEFIVEFKEKNNLSNCFIYDYLPYNQIPQSLAIGDVAFVSQSEVSSSLVAPSKLYGHLAAGTPIALVCPEKSYLKNLIEDSKCGKWFNNKNQEDLANWILKLYKNKSLRESYSLNALDL